MASPRLARHRIFVNQVARLARSGFTALFGERLFSLQAFLVSACYSIAAWGLFDLLQPFLARFALVFAYPQTLDTSTQHSPFVWAATFLALGTVPALVSSLSPPKWWFILALCALVIFASIITSRSVEVAADEGLFLALLALSFVCDVSFIVLVRWVLLRIATSTHFATISLVVVLNCCLAFALFVGPIVIANQTDLRTRLPYLLYFFGSTNVLDVVVSLFCILLALSLLGHRLLWPIFSRPLYAVADLGVAKRRNVSGLAGFLLLSYAGIGVPEGFRKLIETIL
jgi:hypothetical protein